MYDEYAKHLEIELVKADAEYLNLKKRLDYFKANDSSNALKNLWDSSKNFWYRFYDVPPKLAVGLLVFQEEVAEFVEEAKAIQENRTQPDTRQNLIEEGVDVIVTQIMCLLSQGVSWSEMETAITNVCLKNDAKTHETHAIDPDTGKITRKSRLVEKNNAN